MVAELASRPADTRSDAGCEVLPEKLLTESSPAKKLSARAFVLVTKLSDADTIHNGGAHNLHVHLTGCQAG